MMQRQILSALWRLVASLDSQKHAAAQLGVSGQYLNDVLRQRRQPGPKILKALGVQKINRYEKV